MFGYLFGYPEYAVEWVSENGQPKSPTGESLFGFVFIRVLSARMRTSGLEA
jgi:hypothetical protein